MRVLGIDPGLRITGYAVVELARAAPALVEAGTLRSRPKEPLERRLRALFADLSEVLAEFEPAALGLESLYSEYRYPRAALQMAHARGIVCLAAALREVPVVDISPAEVKGAVVGGGRASKEQVQRTVQALYNLAEPPKPPDVADAIAIATAVAYRLRAQEGMP